MELKVGEEFDFFGYTLKVEKSQLRDCFKCFFCRHGLACYLDQINYAIGPCINYLRSDDSHVIFKEQ